MSYRLRLVMGILIVITPILILMTMNRMSIIMDLTYEREMNRLNSIGQLLTDEVEEKIERKAEGKIKELLASSALQTNIIRINVIDGTGHIVYSSDSTGYGKKPLLKDSEEIFRFKGDTYVKSFPMHTTSRERYKLQILYSLTNTYDDFATALRWAIAYDIFLFAAAAIMAWMVSGFMERPVRQATDAAKRIATGDFNVNFFGKTSDAYGQLLEALGTMAGELKDLTQNMQDKIDAATAELIDKNKRLSELDTLKTEFVAMVSHELRTPLTSIIGFARTLQRVQISKEQREEYTQIIESEGKHLASLIEEYLDISKIESGNFVLSLKQTDIGFLLQQTVDHSPWAENVSTRIPDDIPQIYVDEQRLRRVINNLLENSVRHGGKNVRIHLSVEYQKENISIRISDNGPGIASEEAERVFEKFFRGKTKAGGSGLGLTIVKAIIESHGGEIMYDGVAGEGAAFRINLPVPTEPQTA